MRQLRKIDQRIYFAFSLKSFFGSLLTWDACTLTFNSLLLSWHRLGKNTIHLSNLHFLLLVLQANFVQLIVVWLDGLPSTLSLEMLRSCRDLREVDNVHLLAWCNMWFPLLWSCNTWLIEDILDCHFMLYSLLIFLIHFHLMFCLSNIYHLWPCSTSRSIPWYATAWTFTNVCISSTILIGCSTILPLLPNEVWATLMMIIGSMNNSIRCLFNIFIT